MTDDIRSVMWKEWKLIFRRGSRIRLVGTLVGPALLTVYSSISLGRDWLENFLPIIASLLAAVVLVAITVPDSFAGEKERRTLSTLLASRLPDRAILVGKLAVSVVSGWSSAIIALVLGFMIANAWDWNGSISFYQPRVFYAATVFSLLLAVLAGGIGVLISMRAETAQEAAQWFMMAFLFPPLLLAFVFTAVLAGGEGVRDAVIDAVDAIGSPYGLASLTLGLLAANFLLFRVVFSRFQRHNLTR